MSRSSALVRVLAGPEVPSALTLRTAIVRAVDTTVTPYTVDVDLGGVTVTGVTFLAGHDMQAGATVHVLQQGPLVLVLGPLAPARMVVAEHNHTVPPVNPSAPPAPPAAPVAPAAKRTVSVTADTSSSWAPSFGNWRVDGVYQGGTGQRGFWFYGSKVAAAKGAGTIIAASVFVRRATSGGVSGGANVRLGTHNAATQPASGGTAHSNVSTIGSLLKGQGKTLPLTASQVAALNAGADGVGLEPGAAGYVTADYLIAQPRSAGDWSGVLSLTIEG